MEPTKSQDSKTSITPEQEKMRLRESKPLENNDEDEKQNDNNKQH